MVTHSDSAITASSRGSTGKDLRGLEPAKVRERLQRGAVSTSELDDPRQGCTGHGARADLGTPVSQHLGAWVLSSWSGGGAASLDIMTVMVDVPVRWR
jgi:hypothetical protein